MTFFKVNDRCNGCLACVQNCPATALRFRDHGGRRSLSHNMAICARCATCWRVCPQDAIEFAHMLENRWDEVVSLELVQCITCGEPLFTDRFKNQLEEKNGSEVELLCARHKAERSSLELAYPLSRKERRRP
jgi:ferredoxin